MERVGRAGAPATAGRKESPGTAGADRRANSCFHADPGADFNPSPAYPYIAADCHSRAAYINSRAHRSWHR